ncbi:MAG TPA: branched-chain amino acid ABC transporter permease [Actinomycetota bacterium]|jgi:branched-chain amino acid transport system permease protein|nr:branched-chain amino acid ABC transporter permease [Actinomycetota bacterium]
MAKTAKPAAGQAPPEHRELLPARQVDLRKAVRIGLASGAAAVFIAADGILLKFAETNVVDGVGLGYLILVAVPLVLGYVAAKPPPRIEGFQEARAGIRNLAAGGITGALTGLTLGLFLFVAGSINIRPVFTNVSPELVERLTVGGSVPIAVLLMLLGGAAVGILGGALHLIPNVWRRPLFGAVLWVLAFGLLEDVAETIFENTGAVYVDDFLYQRGGGLSAVGGAIVFAVFFALYVALRRRPLSVSAFVDGLPENRRRPARLAIGALVVLLLLILPPVFERNYTHILNVAGIFLLMALGLNIVVGLAGLLDLGYVAFFAVGAYTTAVFTSPGSPAFAPELTFWAALPAVVLAAAVAGILVGVPVLRMRGDYLAIVTLGFGEITRLIVGSDWAAPVFGAARGVRGIPNITFLGIELDRPQELYYVILAFLVLVVYISYALQDSRMGRAWMAIREDETVAEAMGINVVAAKLWAFIIGAVLASFGGALYATQIGSVFPNTFKLIVSITVLVVIITGGLASVPGVILGSLVLVGLPEILRQFEEYRFLIYGALLIFMMLKRPEGFIPSRRRMQELHEEEVGQDAWLRTQQERHSAEAG